MTDPVRRTWTRRIIGATAAAALALSLAACGNEADGKAAGEGAGDTTHGDTTHGGTTQGTGFPVTVESGGVETTIEAEPQRIVSLSPSATETLFSIGAGDRVVAADAYSNYPAEAPTTDLSGYEPNIEAIIAHEPDLVVAANDSNELVASLAKVGVPVLISDSPADLEEAYDRMATLGIATGQVDETAAEVKRIRDEVDAVLADAPESPVRVLHELDATHYTASSWSFIGSVYEALGAVNVADAADEAKAGYPQLTEEAIIEADPQVIVISDGVDYGTDDVAGRAGWADVSAVREGNVVALDEDVISRWGTRLPELVKSLAGALESASAHAHG